MHEAQGAALFPPMYRKPGTRQTDEDQLPQPPPKKKYRIATIGNGIPITHSSAKIPRLAIPIAVLLTGLSFTDANGHCKRKGCASDRNRLSNRTSREKLPIAFAQMHAQVPRRSGFAHLPCFDSKARAHGKCMTQRKTYRGTGGLSRCS